MLINKLMLITGNDFYSKGNFYSAINEFEKILDLEPNNYICKINIIKTKIKLGYCQDALDDVVKILETNNNSELKILKVDILEKTNKIYELQEYIKKILDEIYEVDYYEKLINIQKKYSIVKKCETISYEQQLEIGYKLINSGKYTSALNYFNKILDPNRHEGYLARGVIYTLQGEMHLALSDFTSAIKLNMETYEIYVRRATVYYFLGYIKKSIKDYDLALTCNKTRKSEIFFSRASMLKSLGDYKSAIKDFKNTIQNGLRNSAVYMNIGLCLEEIGDSELAIIEYEKGLKITALLATSYADNSDVSLLYLHIGNSYKQIGNSEQSIEYINKAYDIDKTNPEILISRAASKYSLGEIQYSLSDYMLVIQSDSFNCNALYNAGICYSSLGSFRKAVETFSKLLKINSNHHAWYHKEYSLFMHHHLDESFDNFNMDKKLNPYFKEALCNRQLYKNLLEKNIYKNMETFNGECPDVNQDYEPNENEKKILDCADYIGKKLQLDCRGFSKNKKQYRMCGLAVIEMAQQMKKLINNNDENSFGFRNLMEIAVKYRQISEPNDYVFWIDSLTKETFEKGFGLDTPLHIGQTKVQRYYPYYEKGLNQVKNLLLKMDLELECKNKINNSKDCEDLIDVIGSEFYVTTSVPKTSNKNEFLEGTRLNITKCKYGHKFSISTPAFPKRTQEFNQELNYLFNNLIEEGRKNIRNIDKISDLIIRIYFYNINCGFLSRGSAATSLMLLLALFCSFDIELLEIKQKNVQLDFEAIIGSDTESFVKYVKSWLYGFRKDVDMISGLCDMKKIIETPRKMLQLLNIIIK